MHRVPKPPKIKNLEDELNVEVTDTADTIHKNNLILLPNTNHIFLFGVEDTQMLEPLSVGEEPGVEYTMANRFIRNVNIARSNGPGTPLLIHMKTCGGMWEEGMAIYDTIKSFPAPVTILNYTHARSMSSIIFQAADKRVMMPHSSFMFHRGTLQVSGIENEVESFVEWVKKTSKTQMLEIYINALKNEEKFGDWNPEEIEKMLNDDMDRNVDCYKTAPETVEWGFADEIFDGDWGALTRYDEKFLAKRGFISYKFKDKEYGNLTKYTKTQLARK